jgi:hypothetical protein
MLEEELGAQITEQTRRLVTIPRAEQREAQFRELGLISEPAARRRHWLRTALAILGRMLEDAGRQSDLYRDDLGELD